MKDKLRFSCYVALRLFLILITICFFRPSPSDFICSGEIDEGVLVPEPLCQANSAAHQENPGQDSQLHGQGQGVVREALEAAAWCRGGLRHEPGVCSKREDDKGKGKAPEEILLKCHPASSSPLLSHHFRFPWLPSTDIPLWLHAHWHLVPSFRNQPAFVMGRKSVANVFATTQTVDCYRANNVDGSISRL